MKNIVVHWEFGSCDPESLGKFYADLLGWRIQAQPSMDYRVVFTQSKQGINGGIAPVDDEASQFLTFYVVVESLDSTLGRAGDLGASTVVPPTQVPGVGTFAQIADPQGFVVGVIEPPPDWDEQSVPERQEGGGKPVVHWEIGSGDAPALHDFYTTLFDWQVDTDTPLNYPVVQTGGEGGINGGIYAAEDPEHRFLTIYVQVDDLPATLEKAGSLGASYVGEIATVPGIGRFSIFGDPEGRIIGVMEEESSLSG